MHNSVMRLTISNKKIINYAPHIVTSIILFFICQQLAQLTENNSPGKLYG